MHLRTDRGGFALPMVILVIGFMTAGGLAAFARSGAEVQLIDNQRAQTASFAAAETGLERFIGTGRVPRVSLDTTFTYKFGKDSAVINANLVRPGATATAPALWLIRSTGMVPGGAGRPPGVRTVAQLAWRITGTMHVVSAWTSLSGLHKNGAAGDISGANACGNDTLAGVAVPTGLITGKDDAISGNPDVLEMGTKQQMADEIKIDWNGIVNAGNPAISADYVVCLPGTYGYDAGWGPCVAWPPSSLFTNPDFWPTIVINGTSPLPSNGRGTLIVTGDLTFGGGDKWDGIILVGGKITDNGSGNIAGAVVSGLNIKRPDPWPSTVGESSKANGTKDYTYDSCKVASAAAGQSKISQIPNAWIDNWTSW